MNAEHLLDAIGQLDDDLIREAEEYRRSRVNVRPWLGLAACVAVVLTMGYGMIRLGFFSMGGGAPASGNGASGGTASVPASSAPAGENGGAGVPDVAEPQAPEAPEGDATPAIMVDGVLYRSTGKALPGEPDPSVIQTVTSYTSGTPEMDGQSNFSQDLTAQYARIQIGREWKLAVLMESEWILFEPVE